MDNPSLSLLPLFFLSRINYFDFLTRWSFQNTKLDGVWYLTLLQSFSFSERSCEYKQTLKPFHFCLKPYNVFRCWAQILVLCAPKWETRVMTHDARNAIPDFIGFIFFSTAAVSIFWKQDFRRSPSRVVSSALKTKKTNTEKLVSSASPSRKQKLTGASRRLLKKKKGK